MNQATLNLETSITGIAQALAFISSEASTLNKYYFDSGASTLVNALATADTPATLASALTKGEVTNGITMIQELVDFFGNASVATGDYQSTADNLINGSNPIGAALSQDVENIGNRLKVIGTNLRSIRNDCEATVKLYNSSELSAVIGSLSSSLIIYGCSTSQSKMISGIVLCQQVVKFLNNEAVTTGDYQSTVSNWIN